MEENLIEDQQHTPNKLCDTVFFTEPTYKSIKRNEKNKNLIKINEKIDNAENEIYKIINNSLLYNSDFRKFNRFNTKINANKIIKNNNLINRFQRKNKTTLKTQTFNNRDTFPYSRNIETDKTNSVKNLNTTSNIDSPKKLILCEKKVPKFHKPYITNISLNNSNNYDRNSISVSNIIKESNQKNKNISFNNHNEPNKTETFEKSLEKNYANSTANYNLTQTKANLSKIYLNCIRDIKSFKYLNIESKSREKKRAKINSSFEKLLKNNSIGVSYNKNSKIIRNSKNKYNSCEKDKILEEDLKEKESNKDNYKKAKLKDILFKSKNDIISNLSEKFAYNINNKLLKIFSTDGTKTFSQIRMKKFKIKNRNILNDLEDDNRNVKLLIKRVDNNLYKYKNNDYFFVRNNKKNGNNKNFKFKANKIYELPHIDNKSNFAKLFYSPVKNNDFYKI